MYGITGSQQRVCGMIKYIKINMRLIHNTTEGKVREVCYLQEEQEGGRNMDTHMEGIGRVDMKMLKMIDMDMISTNNNNNNNSMEKDTDRDSMDSHPVKDSHRDKHMVVDTRDSG